MGTAVGLRRSLELRSHRLPSESPEDRASVIEKKTKLLDLVLLIARRGLHAVSGVGVLKSVPMAMHH